MPKFDWRNGFALGISVGGFVAIGFLVWFVGLNYCPGEPCAYNGYPTDNQSYHEPYIPLGVGPNTTSGFEPEDTKGNEHYYERQDLRAQESVARATNSLVWLTFASSILGFGGAGLLVWTLVETRKNNAITREIGEAQVRAYLTIDECYVIPSAYGEEVFFDLRCSIRNCGQSPARRLQASIFAENKKQSAGYILPDIAAGGECNFSSGFSIDKQKIVLFGESAEIALLMVSIEIQFEDVFQLNTGKTIETADFVGRFKIENGIEVELNSVGRFMSDVRTGNVPKHTA